MIKKITYCILFCIPLSGQGQTLTDGLMMTKGNLCTGFMYSLDQWDKYWEGGLRRENGNIGKVTTQQVMWAGIYGLNDKVNIIGMLPYVWTKASQGTLAPMQGVQDLTVGAKYRFIDQGMGIGTIKAFGVGTYSVPMSNYTPDYLPLSIGLAAQQISGRVTLNYTLENGLYVNGTGAYTWRYNVMLDRPAYYTNGQLYLTNEVKMPNVVDYSFSVGYVKEHLQTFLVYTQQNTLGGGDIRRQDMPFVSNRMNYSRLETVVMYYLPKWKDLALRGSAGYVIAGRNVGQSATFMGGFFYTFHFKREQPAQ